MMENQGIEIPVENVMWLKIGLKSSINLSSDICLTGETSQRYAINFSNIKQWY